MKIYTDSIDGARELKEIGSAFEQGQDSEIKLSCPFHEDNQPSLSLNTAKGVFKCYACQESGDVIKLLAKLRKRSRRAEIAHLDLRYAVYEVKSIDPDYVSKCVANLRGKEELLAELTARGVTGAMVKSARLGYHDGRITIPVYDEAHNCRNVALYSPGAPRNKFKNTKGYGRIRLYRPKDLEKQRIWVCGGYLKALVVGETLRAIGAVSVGGSGEGSWDPNWNIRFKDKEVWVCMDVDAAGQNAAIRIANQLVPFARRVKIVHLPLDEKTYPKGDVNDYLGKEKAGAKDLLTCMEQASVHTYIARGTPTIDYGPKTVPFDAILGRENHGYRLTSEAVVHTVEGTTSHVAGRVHITCDRSQPLCGQCPIFGQKPDHKGGIPMVLSTRSEYLVPLAISKETSRREFIRQAIGIPRCKTFEYQTQEHYSVKDLQLMPDMGGSGTAVHAFAINLDPAIGSMCTIGCKLAVNPNDSEAVLLVDFLEESDDMALPLSETELKSLEIFQPVEWTRAGLDAKLEDIYRDIEANVTGVFGRRDVHVVVDLTYHSPLLLRLEGKRINGWINSLIIGDTSQGKTEIRRTLTDHYRAGESIDCKNATVAGILGGVRQVGNKWYQTWGRVPMNDKRFVWFEEMKGLRVEEIGKLTEMRSSGVAEIQKIEAAKTYARTRLCCITNPRDSRAMKDYQFGIDAVMKLIGSPEDVRRFDIAIGLAAKDIGDIEKLRHTTEHVYSSEICNRLIRWSWMLGREEVNIPKETLEAIKKVSKRLLDQYHSSVPLVDKGTMRQKVARMSAALAARTFSCNEKGNLWVRVCHVSYIEDLIQRCYKGLEYDKYSARATTNKTIRDEEQLQTEILQCRSWPNLVSLLRDHEEILAEDVADVCDLDREAARGILSFLYSHRAIRKGTRGRNWRKTPAFVPVLTRLSEIEKPLDTEEM